MLNWLLLQKLTQYEAKKEPSPLLRELASLFFMAMVKIKIPSSPQRTWGDTGGLSSVYWTSLFVCLFGGGGIDQPSPLPPSQPSQLCTFNIHRELSLHHF